MADNNLQNNEGLFDENSLDEMQKAENYRIGFRLFRACYWFMYFFSLYIFIAAANMENTLFTVCGLISMTAASVFHIIYSAMVSAKGVMNIRYAKKMSMSYNIPVYTIIIILSGMAILMGRRPIAVLMLFIPYVMVICDCIFAKRNMRVLEKMLKDENEEE